VSSSTVGCVYIISVRIRLVPARVVTGATKFVSLFVPGTVGGSENGYSCLHMSVQSTSAPNVLVIFVNQSAVWFYSRGI
jgi:hypothetical protein